MRSIRIRVHVLGVRDETRVAEIISQDVVPGVRGPEVTYISGALRDKQIDAVPFDTSNERKECRAKTEANYDGIQISIVTAVSWSACCDACLSDPACAVWTFCDDVNGCDGEFSHQTCVLKSSWSAVILEIRQPSRRAKVFRGSAVRSPIESPNLRLRSKVVEWKKTPITRVIRLTVVPI